MELLLSLIPCCLNVMRITIEEITDIKHRIRQKEPDAALKLIELIDNIKRYDKKSRKLIIENVKLYIELNISANGSILGDSPISRTPENQTPDMSKLTLEELAKELLDLAKYSTVREEKNEEKKE